MAPVLPASVQLPAGAKAAAAAAPGARPSKRAKIKNRFTFSIAHD